MSPTTFLATGTARWIRRHLEEAGSEEVLVYSLTIVYQTLAVWVTVLAVSFWTGRAGEALLTLVVFGLLRMLTGGLHFQSAAVCYGFTSVAILAIAHLHPADYSPVMLGFNLFAMLWFACFAPRGLEHVTRIPARAYPWLKGIAIVLAASNLLLHSPLLTVICAFQALTLTPILYNTKGRNTHETGLIENH